MAAHRRLQGYGRILLNRQLRVLDEDGEPGRRRPSSFHIVPARVLPLPRRYDEVRQLRIELLEHIVRALPSVVQLLLEVTLVVLLDYRLFVAEVVVFVGEDLRGMTVDVVNRLPQVLAVGPDE